MTKKISLERTDTYKIESKCEVSAGVSVIVANKVIDHYYTNNGSTNKSNSRKNDINTWNTYIKYNT